MNSLFYNIKQGFVQIFRNRGMSLASIFSIVAMLLILGLFFVITVNINLFTEVVKQDYDQVEVFLLDKTTKADAEQLMAEIKKQDGVSGVEYRSKDDALQILKQRWGESGYLLNSLGENPLPASILISVDSLDNAGALARYAGTLEGVDDIQYYQETVDKLTKITNFLQIGALVIMAFLVVVSVVVVSNTVKLTVFARAKEIRIMKYVGATNNFIRAPFVVEGIILGVISSLISIVLLGGLYVWLKNGIIGNALQGWLKGFSNMSSGMEKLLQFDQMFSEIMVIFLAIGIGIGVFGSILSMKKYLKV